MVAPLALAAVLPAQLKGLTPAAPQKPAAQQPVATPAAPPAQEPTPAEQLEQLNRDKARLEREIQYATQRVDQAKALLSSKMQRAMPVFQAIDAGKPASAVPLAPKQLPRKFARIGTADEMNFGGNTALVMVNGRAISQASYDSVMNYLTETGVGGTEAQRAQRVLFDMIRIEAVAGEFIENEGEVKLSENLVPLENGTKSFAEAAKEFGTVQGGSPEGVVQVTRNSMLGPYFEYVAFSTPVSKTARPFRTTNGYVMLKVDSHENGEKPAQDKVMCQVVQFAYSADQTVLQQAQFKANSGQIDILVRDQQVLDLLPALFKPAAPRLSPADRMNKMISDLEATLKEVGDDDAEKRASIEKQLNALRERQAQMQRGVPATPITPQAEEIKEMKPVKGEQEAAAKAKLEALKAAKGKGN